MFKDTEGWSPDGELRLLEELAEAELQTFEEEVELSVRVAPTDSERPWVAYWNLPQVGVRPKSRLGGGK